MGSAIYKYQLLSVMLIKQQNTAHLHLKGRTKQHVLTDPQKGTILTC